MQAGGLWPEHNGERDNHRKGQTSGLSTLRARSCLGATFKSSALHGTGARRDLVLRLQWGDLHPDPFRPGGGTVWVFVWAEGTTGSANVFTLSADGKQIGSQTTSSHGPVTIPWEHDRGGQGRSHSDG